MDNTINVNLRDHEFRVTIEKGPDHKFWTKQYRNWEEGTFSFLDEFVGPENLFIDVGAWIGPLSLYAAAKGARVIAFEPDPVARDSLEKNLLLNNLQADVRATALSDSSGGLTIAGGRKGFGRSTTSSMSTYFLNKTTVDSFSVEDLDLLIDEKTVLKIDIEGHEFNIHKDLSELFANHDIPIHLSVHPKILQKHFRNRLHLNSNSKASTATLEFLRSIDRAAPDPACKNRNTVEEMIMKIQYGDVSNFDVVLRPRFHP